MRKEGESTSMQQNTSIETVGILLLSKWTTFLQIQKHDVTQEIKVTLQMQRHYITIMGGNICREYHDV